MREPTHGCWPSAEAALGVDFELKQNVRELPAEITEDDQNVFVGY